jgi:hypothetical protein
VPWRGPVVGSDLLEDQFPSLGWQIADRLDEVFWWMPCTNEQVRKLVECYRIDPATGGRMYRRAQFMGPKGCGKSPEAAKFALAELCLDVVPDGWDAGGDPVGKPGSKPSPWVQIAAVSLDQTDNTYGALQELLTEHDGQASDVLGLDCGDTRTVKRANHRSRIDKVTAASGTREGQPITAAILDETHLWTPTTGGRNLARVIRRNAGKMDGFTLETTNAYDPALNTVAQATDDAAIAGADGIYQWKPQVPHMPSLANRREVTSALRKLYVDCHWTNPLRLWAEMADPDNTEADNRRFYLNEVWAGADAAWDEPTWDALRHPDGLVQPPDRDRVAIGFDGARFHDATALVGVRLEDRHEFLIRAWEKPLDTEDDDWEVPGADVALAVEMAFDRWKVALAYCDPPYWEDEVDRWAGQFGPVKKWWTNRPKPMAYSVRAFDQMLTAGGMTHDGNPTLTAHHLNAQKRATVIRDDEGRFLWTIQKKAPKSPQKIDARMAGLLAHEAAGDAIALGALKKRKSKPSAYA